MTEVMIFIPLFETTQFCPSNHMKHEKLKKNIRNERVCEFRIKYHHYRCRSSKGRRCIPDVV